MEILNQISESIQKMKANDAVNLVNQALEQGISPKQILNDGLVAGMQVVGGRFKRNEIFVPEVLVAARAMSKATVVLKPHLVSSGVEPIGKAIICTVKGDLHDIGKNLVRMMLEGAGIEVVDLGVDVSPEKIIEAIQTEKPQVVCLSALLTTTMVAQKETIDAINSAGIRNSVKIMVGGAPVTEEYAREIGADAYTSDAASAAETAVQLLKAS